MVGKKTNDKKKKDFLKFSKLFLIIKTTAKNGVNKITCSHTKHNIGKKTKTLQFNIFGENFFSDKIKLKTKNNISKVSFLPKDSISAIG